MRSEQIFSAAMVWSSAGLGQKAGLPATLAQPHNAGEGIHHPETAPGGRGGDQEPAIVGAQVQHRQQGACPGPLFLRFLVISVHFSPTRRSLRRAQASTVGGGMRGQKGTKTRPCKGVGGWSKGAVPAGASLVGDRLTVGLQTLTLPV